MLIKYKRPSPDPSTAADLLSLLRRLPRLDTVLFGHRLYPPGSLTLGGDEPDLWRATDTPYLLLLLAISSPGAVPHAAQTGSYFQYEVP